MTAVACSLVSSPEHTLEDHPENPGRFVHFSRLKEAPLGEELVWLHSEPAPVEAVASVHTQRLIEYLQKACARSRSTGAAVIDPAPTYVTPGSWQAALNAAGGALAASRAVLRGPVWRSFALVRPPGHHCGPDQSSGFCLLNNLAIAVADALSGVFPGGPQKVAIVDFDAHHGNGTEEIFLNHPEVGFFSLHQEGIYPGSGAIDEAPRARGRLINLPLPAYTGDQGLEQITEQVLWPWLQRFSPEMLFVSAGFDGHWSDPLTSLGFSTMGYFKLAGRLAAMADELCSGKVVFILEGGYDPGALEDNIRAVLCALTGMPEVPDPSGLAFHPEPDISPRIKHLRELHRI